MSSTGRGAVRAESDLYPTPEAAFRPLLPYIKQTGETCFWEPACGDQRLIRWMNQAGLQAGGADIATTGYDFLKDKNRWPAIVTNPPFSLALEFVQHAIAHADHVFMLLRLGFLASEERRRFWAAHPPTAMFILCNRPNFVMSCKCDLPECRHAWTLPIESVRPKQCAKCGWGKVKISTSDSADYFWCYHGPTHKGVFFL